MAAGEAATGDTAEGRAAGGRPMTVATSIPFVRAEGDSFRIGHQHGLARAGSLRAFIDDSVGRLNLVMQTAVSLDELAPALSDYAAAIAAATPDLAEEIRGLAHGAGISWQHALLLQLRREIMGYRKVPAIGGCTTYARAGGCATYARAGSEGTSVLAQTVDLNGNLDDQIAVLEIAHARAQLRWPARLSRPEQRRPRGRAEPGAWRGMAPWTAALPRHTAPA